MARGGEELPELRDRRVELQQGTRQPTPGRGDRGVRGTGGLTGRRGGHNGKACQIPERSRSAPTAGTRQVTRQPSYSDRMPRPFRSRSARGARAAGKVLPTVEETSAGGIVVDVDGDPPRAAVIARVNRAGRVEWCLPKGHLEGGETPEEAAVREIAEETGILGRVIGSLGTIDYWFSAEGRRVHKSVHHYLLLAVGGRLTIDGDPDQEAIDVAWVPLTDLGALLAFPNERRIAREASVRLADSA